MYCLLGPNHLLLQVRLLQQSPEDQHFASWCSTLSGGRVEWTCVVAVPTLYGNRLFLQVSDAFLPHEKPALLSPSTLLYKYHAATFNSIYSLRTKVRLAGTKCTKSLMMVQPRIARELLRLSGGKPDWFTGGDDDLACREIPAPEDIRAQWSFMYRFLRVCEQVATVIPPVWLDAGYVYWYW